MLLTEKPVPETVTNCDGDCDVREDRTKTGEKSQKARTASRGEGYMPVLVPVSDQADKPFAF